VVHDDAPAIAVLPGKSAELTQPRFDPHVQASPAIEDLASASAGRDMERTATPDLQGHLQTILLGGLLAASLLGTCVLLTVHGVHALKLCRWLGRTGTDNALLAESCASVAATLGVRRVVRCCVVDARTTPLLWAWRQPLVVVPRPLIDELGPEQLRGIVAHELAHLLRRDYWTNLFVFLVKAMLWWNPVVWWADRELRAAQELCCDAMAIACSHTTRRSYATTLLKALDFIQAEPIALGALATGMGSRKAVLRRFEMIGETRLSYRLSRWSSLVLVALAIPLVCIPVRAEEKGPADAGDKDRTAKDECPKPDKTAEMPPRDPEAQARVEALQKRISALRREMAGLRNDQLQLTKRRAKLQEAELELSHQLAFARRDLGATAETLTLNNGQTARMKLTKNVTPVRELQITPHFVEHGTTFELEGVDAAGKTIEGTKLTSHTIHDGGNLGMGLGKTFPVDDKRVLCTICLLFPRKDGNSVTVKVDVSFKELGGPQETEAMLLSQGKTGRVHLDLQKIADWVTVYERRTGH
jgi:beta-lactamase regulating signal transducer with metallopeptidase domain